jgi:putative restriction endonuclease
MTNLLQQLLSLNRGITRYGKAPHKPVMLLAVAEGFEKGYLNRQEIPITDELLASFYDIWKLLVTTPHTPDFALPFFHLGSEKSGIWKLVPLPGCTIPVTKSNSIKSFRALRQTVQYALLSEELYRALMDAAQRQEIKNTLVEKYFPETAYLMSDNRVNRYSEEVRKEILYEPDVNYARNVVRHFERITTEEREQEMIFRGHIFRKSVLELYDFRCSVTGLKVEFQGNVTLVDACHIIPFHQSHDDTIGNGIALSPTFHRAFDSGLIGISDDYRVIVNRKVTDHSLSQGIAAYEGEKILLPREERFWPSREKLREQRRMIV